MDEPLASLDEARKTEILPYIERLHDEAGVPIVYVSHAIAEVARLATTMVVLSDGHVAATGPPTEIMGRIDLFPLTGRAEAGAILATRVAGHDRAFGLTTLRAAAGALRVPHLDLPVGAALRVRIRARDVMIALAPPVGLSALNVLPGDRRGNRPRRRADRRDAARLRRRGAGGAADPALGRNPRPRTRPPGLRGDQEHRLRPPRLRRRRPSPARRRRRDAAGLIRPGRA